MNIKDLESIITLFNAHNLSSLEVKEKDLKIKVQRQTVTVAPPAYASSEPQTVPTSKEKEKKVTETITSPIVGTFYRTPSPDAPPYVEVGDTVHKGDILCTIEAMKIMNQLEADFDCEIVKIYPEQASMIEVTTPLFEVKRI
ncbi:MAG: acetyl-CoA carboxylase biotin carboxyl carrier protein [Sphaerochaetaceae bacterium]|nr:acetyl-CoA carboxylase biotin carboxyl carrier protein [Sphaerochaetaceae bacterium]